jgi:AraC family transcriptional regulator
MPRKRRLDSSESLQLDFRNPLTRPDTHRRLQYRGLTLEYTRVTTATEYDFSWVGHHHYLALHDLVMEHGEMDVDGLPTVAGSDLRNKMTYAPAGRPLKGWSKTTGRQNSFTVLHFDPATLSVETGRVLGDEDTVPLIYFDDPQLLATMKKLESVVADGLDHPSVYVETAALLATLELANLQTRTRSVAERTGRLSTAQETLLRDYIEDHLATDISLDELSQLTQLSRFHMARRFKATFGVPPHRYIIDKRIDLAKRLLSEGTLPVTDVAKTVGFSSAALFIRTFRAATGVTPLVFRRSR